MKSFAEEWERLEATWAWRNTWIPHPEASPLEVIRAARERPELRSCHPFTSHFWLTFKTPGGIPFGIRAVRGGHYEVMRWNAEGRDPEELGTGELSWALDLVAAALNAEAAQREGASETPSSSSLG